MTKIIEGLYIEMSSARLKKLLKAKERYHEEKTKWYRKKADEMGEEVTDTVGTADNFKYASNDPTSSLRQSQVRHMKKAAFFKLLTENLIKAKTYRLSQDDCITLELYDRSY